MYTKTIPFKDFKNNPRNITIHLNLSEREVFKLVPEFQSVLEWRKTLGGEERILDAVEIRDFYNNLEEILLSAYGEPSDDGMHFRKGGRYDFEDSATFNALMVMFVSEPSEAIKMIEELLPEGMEELIKKADANQIEMLKDSTDEDLKAELARLKAQLKENQS